ncbi:MAG TPA: thioredoxin domain-containing protein [Solirubrobacterales bacterium]|nr:thioredoxin domain-containing protein [Solirubrobacterales bacterium]
MSSRADSKQAAREARVAAEREEAAKQRRQRVWALAGGAALLAAIVVVVLILVSAGGSDGDGEASGELAQFDGIPQSGIELGDPQAPVTLVEFADPQCPFCRDYTADVMPGLIEQYVAPGDLRMELQLLTFIGPDSEAIARAAQAAGEQDLLWQFMDVAYARQGVENSGYADQSFIDGAGEAAGVDVEEMNASVESAAVTKALEDAQAAAADAGINSTPSFLVGPTGGELEPVPQDGLAGAIDEALAGAK